MDGYPMYVKSEGGGYEVRTYEDKDTAILAALDEMEEGDTIHVHEAHCTGPGSCCCTPQTWTY